MQDRMEKDVPGRTEFVAGKKDEKHGLFPDA
jgi:hypothetical protein